MDCFESDGFFLKKKIRLTSRWRSRAVRSVDLFWHDNFWVLWLLKQLRVVADFDSYVDWISGGVLKGDAIFHFFPSFLTFHLTLSTQHEIILKFHKWLIHSFTIRQRVCFIISHLGLFSSQKWIYFTVFVTLWQSVRCLALSLPPFALSG